MQPVATSGPSRSPPAVLVLLLLLVCWVGNGKPPTIIAGKGQEGGELNLTTACRNRKGCRPDMRALPSDRPVEVRLLPAEHYRLYSLQHHPAGYPERGVPAGVGPKRVCSPTVPLQWDSIGMRCELPSMRIQRNAIRLGLLFSPVPSVLTPIFY